jgi:hypothetical protein
LRRRQSTTVSRILLQLIEAAVLLAPRHKFLASMIGALLSAHGVGAEIDEISLLFLPSAARPTQQLRACRGHYRRCPQEIANVELSCGMPQGGKAIG